jgi:quinol monooxygenase YgiN
VVEVLKTLPALIPEIRAYQVALDVVRDDRSYDVALIGDFADRAALDRYLAHPAHQRVVEADIAPFLADLAVADFEA